MAALRKFQVLLEFVANTSAASNATRQYVLGTRQGAQQAAHAWDETSRHIEGQARIIGTVRESLKSYFAIVAAQAAPRALIEYANAWQNIGNRLRIVTTSTQQFQQAQSAVYRIAKETHQPLEATAELYQRITQYSGQLGLTSQKTAAVVDTVAKAVALSGASAVTAEQGIRQLAQGLASGTLRGQDLRAVLDDLPGVTQALTTGLGVSLGELRKMSAAGELTAQQVIQAFQNSASQTDAAYSKFHRTIAMSFTDLRTETIHYIGTMDDAMHASQAFGGAIEVVGKHLNLIVAAAAGFATYKLAPILLNAAGAAAKSTVSLVQNAAAYATNTSAAQLNAQAQVRRLDALKATAIAEVQRQHQLVASAQAALVQAQANLRGAATAEARAAATEEVALAERGLTVATRGSSRAAQLAATTSLELAAARRVATTATFTLGAAAKGLLGILGGPVGIITLVASVAAGFLLFSDRTDKTTQSIDLLSGSLDEAIKKFNEMNVVQQKNFLLQQGDKLGSLKSASADAFTKLGNLDEGNPFGSTGPTAAGALLASKAGQAWTDALSKLAASKQSVAQLASQVDALNTQLIANIDASNDSASAKEELRRKVIQLSAAWLDARSKAQRVGDAIEAIKGKQNDAAEATGQATTALGAQSTQLHASTDDWNKLLGKLNDGIATAGRSAVSVAMIKAKTAGYSEAQVKLIGNLTRQQGLLTQYQQALAKGDKAQADSIAKTLGGLVSVETTLRSVIDLATGGNAITNAVGAKIAKGDWLGAGKTFLDTLLGNDAEAKAAAEKKLQANLKAIAADVVVTPKAGGGSANNYQQQKNAITQAIAEQHLLTTAIQQHGAAADALTEGQKRMLAIDQQLKLSQDQRTGSYKGLTGAELQSLRADAQKEAGLEKLNAQLKQHAQMVQMVKDLDQQGASELANRNRKNAADIAALSMGDQARTRNSRIDAIYDNYVQREQDAVDRIAAARLAGDAKGVADSQKYYDALERQRDADLKSEARYQKELDAARRDYKVGMDRAVSNYIEQAADISGQTEGLFNDAFGGMEDAMVQFVTTGKLSFKDLANSIISDLVRMETRILISKILMSIFGGGIADNGSAVYASVGVQQAPAGGWAKGGAFGASGVIPFATGGIVNSPTLFKFASGTGLMGEAGPEAIMPLQRGSDGKLGVKAQVAGARGEPLRVEVNITNKGQPVQAKQTGQRQDGNKVIVDMILDTVSGDVASGGRTAKAMQGRFGLQRRGVPVGA